MATATSTSKLYKTVVEDVINNVKEAFLDEGVDEQVLQELKQLWEQKLSASKALEPAPAETEILLPGGTQQLVFPQQQMLGVQHRFPGLPIQLSQAGTELSGAAATATMALPRGLFHQQMAQLTSGGTINGPTITLANGQVLVPQLAPRGQTATTSINIPQPATLMSSQLPPGITMQQIRPVGQVRTVNPNMVQTQHLHGMRQVATNPTNQSERMAQSNQNPHAQPPQRPMGDHGSRQPLSSQSHHLSNPSQHANKPNVNPPPLNHTGKPQHQPNQGHPQHQGPSQHQPNQGQSQHQGPSQNQLLSQHPGHSQQKGPSQHQHAGQLQHHGQQQHPGGHQGQHQGQSQHPNQIPTHQHPNQYLQHPNQPPHSTQSQHIPNQPGHLAHFPNQHQHLIPTSQQQHQQHHHSQQHQQHPMQHQLPPSHHQPPHITNPPYPGHPMHPPHLLPNQQQRMPPAQLQPNTSVSQQMYGMPPRPPRNSNQVLQLDGAGDTSSSDDDDLDDDDENENENENENEEEQGEEEEPLNTDDDISEEDPNDLFDTDNVVVCQYDKINRNKNKWKFHLKDGIMSLRGKDYVFQKANGEAEW